MRSRQQEHTANARVASSSGIGAIIVVESFEILQRGGGTNNAQICLESFYSRLSHAVDYWGQHSVNDGGHDLPVRVLGISAEHGVLQLLSAACFGLVKPTWGLTLDGTLQAGYRPLPAKAREVLDIAAAAAERVNSSRHKHE